MLIQLILALFSILLLAIFIVLGVLYLLESFYYQGNNRTVYMGSNVHEQAGILEEIISKYIGKDTSAYHLVEPGAGMGYVARFLGRRFSWKSVQAIEIRPLVMMAAKLTHYIQGNRPIITWVRGDIFGHSYPKPALIYCYLSDQVLNQLYAEGALEGALVICLTFAIQNQKPVFEKKLASWQGVIRVYDFRKSIGKKP